MKNPMTEMKDDTHSGAGLQTHKSLTHQCMISSLAIPTYYIVSPLRMILFYITIVFFFFIFFLNLFLILNLSWCNRKAMEAASAASALHVNVCLKKEKKNTKDRDDITFKQHKTLIYILEKNKLSGRKYVMYCVVETQITGGIISPPEFVVVTFCELNLCFQGFVSFIIFELIQK